MFYRATAVIALFAIFPAHATLIEYAFTARVDGNVSVATLREFFGPNAISGDVTGGFLFDDAAPITAHEEQQFRSGYPELSSSSTYDMSNLRMWVNVGDYMFTATGVELAIHDDPAFGPWCTCGPVGFHDRWSLSALGDGNEVNGYTLRGLSMNLVDEIGRALTSSELQVPDPAHWSIDPINRSFSIGLGRGMNGYLTSITPTTTSVPEPATLSLLGAGVFGALATRRRRHVGSNV